MQNRSITRRPQNLYLPPFDLPQAISTIPNKIQNIQAPHRIRRILDLERIFRPNMARDHVGTHRRRVRPVLDLDAHIADHMMGDDGEGLSTVSASILSAIGSSEALQRLFGCCGERAY